MKYTAHISSEFLEQLPAIAELQNGPDASSNRTFICVSDACDTRFEVEVLVKQDDVGNFLITFEV